MLKQHETTLKLQIEDQPPSGGCVLKRPTREKYLAKIRPAAFRRLCVETTSISNTAFNTAASRLQAAVC